MTIMLLCKLKRVQLCSYYTHTVICLPAIYVELPSHKGV